MSNAELLIEKVKALPEDSAAEVLDFVGYLEQKAAKQREAASRREAAEAGECPLCARHRDPITGEMRLNARTIAAMREVQDQIDGKTPVKWYASLDAMWEETSHGGHCAQGGA